EFMALNPAVAVHLEAGNRRVDPVAESIDLAIRVRQPPIENSDLVMRVFAERRQCLAASPSLLEQHGLPATPADLADWPSLGHGTPRDEHVWQLRSPGRSPLSIRHRPRFISNDMLTLRMAAVAGIGVVKLPAMFIVNELAEGKLLEVLPEWE